MVRSGAEQVLEHPEYQRRFVDFRQENHAITFQDVLSAVRHHHYQGLGAFSLNLPGERNPAPVRHIHISQEHVYAPGNCLGEF